MWYKKDISIYKCKDNYNFVRVRNVYGYYYYRLAYMSLQNTTII